MQRRLKSRALLATRRGRARYLNRADLDAYLETCRAAYDAEVEWLAIEEAASYLGLASTTVRRRIEHGILSTTVHGRTGYLGR